MKTGSTRCMLEMEGTASQDWRHFPHEGDVGIRGYGTSPAHAFESAARAMVAVVVPLETIRPEKRVAVTCSAPDREILLIDWLNAIIFEIATRRMLFSRFQVEITGDTLKGAMWGEATDPDRHEPAVELKGATLTELSLSQGTDGRWVAQCVFDV